jgi:PAS domain S-box-containing protein
MVNGDCFTRNGIMSSSDFKKTKSELLDELKNLRRLNAELAARSNPVESDNRYRRLMQFLPDGVWIICKGVIVYANEAAIGLFGGTRPEDLVGREAIDFILDDDRAHIAKRYSRVHRSGNLPREEQRRLNLSGEIIELEVAGIAMTWNGLPAVLSVMRDNSARIAARTELRTAKESAEFADQTKSAFLANMSHEIRSPLNAIIGFSDVMKQEMFGPLGSDRYREYAEDILNSGRHLQSLIDDILDLSKLEADAMELVSGEVDIARVIKSSLSVLKRRAQAGEIRLAVRVAEKLPALCGDERRIRQVLFNLLSNASKFTPTGGRVSISAVADKKTGLRISVVDTGIGMRPEDLETALTPFGQVSSHSTAHQCDTGTGLGLPLAKSLVERHGGKLDLKSNLGKGTRVTLRFPPMRLVA